MKKLRDLFNKSEKSYADTRELDYKKAIYDYLEEKDDNYETIKGKMWLWRRGEGSLRSTGYIEYHENLAKQNLSEITSHGWKINKTWMANQGWGDRMEVLHAEISKNNRVENLVWSDSHRTGNWYFQSKSGGQWPIDWRELDSIKNKDEYGEMQQCSGCEDVFQEQDLTDPGDGNRYCPGCLDDLQNETTFESIDPYEIYDSVHKRGNLLRDAKKIIDLSKNILRDEIDPEKWQKIDELEAKVAEYKSHVNSEGWSEFQYNYWKKEIMRLNALIITISGNQNWKELVDDVGYLENFDFPTAKAKQYCLSCGRELLKRDEISGGVCNYCEELMERNLEYPEGTPQHAEFLKTLTFLDPFIQNKWKERYSRVR